MVVVEAFVPESLLAKMEGIGHQYDEYKQTKAMKNPIKAGAYLFVAVITVLILFRATWFGFMSRGASQYRFNDWLKRRRPLPKGIFPSGLMPRRPMKSEP